MFCLACGGRGEVFRALEPALGHDEQNSPTVVAPTGFGSQASLFEISSEGLALSA